MLKREISFQEFIHIVESVGDGTKVLFKIGLFHATMGVKDIHGKSSTHPMNDVKIVLLDCMS